MDQLPIQDVPTQFIVVKPLDEVQEHEEPALVYFLVNPDQLSALVFLCNYRRGDLEPVTAPWGAACQSILFALAELERERPRGIIGFFDIIVQSYLPLPQAWYGQAIPNVKEIVFGALLIIVLLFRPLGILGDMRRDKLMRRVHGG